MPPLFPLLKKSYKKRFPFRLSVPSYIYPAGYAENVERLGPFVDEIELLLFEGRPESLPSLAEIAQMVSLARHFDLSYNVHLPLDLQLGAADQARRNRDAAQMIEVIKHTRPLSPTTHILHLNLDEPCSTPAILHAWQKRTLQSLDNLLVATSLEPRRIAIETLDYPPEWFTPFVKRLDLRVCLDVGHVLRYGLDLQNLLSQFGSKIDMIHLHGATDGQDHLSLDRLTLHARAMLQPYLKDFAGAVSLEVFCFDRLQISLDVLDQMTDRDRKVS